MKTEKPNKIQKLWRDKWKIVEGIYNYLFLKRKYKKIVKRREAICKTCIDYNESGDKCFMPGTQPCCGVCGCSLKFLQNSLSSGCERGKWHAVLSEEEENNLTEYLNNE